MAGNSITHSCRYERICKSSSRQRMSSALWNDGFRSALHDTLAHRLHRREAFIIACDYVVDVCRFEILRLAPIEACSIQSIRFRCNLFPHSFCGIFPESYSPLSSTQEILHIVSSAPVSAFVKPAPSALPRREPTSAAYIGPCSPSLRFEYTQRHLDYRILRFFSAILGQMLC